MGITEIIKDCTIANGNIIRLPDVQYERADYMRVKKLFESNGGKWKGGKCQGFLFDTTDASPILARLQGGDLSDRKKKFQFFETPANVASMLVSRLGDVEPTDRILEPSAGRGALIKAVFENLPELELTVDCYELMEENREVLAEIPNVRLLGDDFMEAEVGMYDKIIANPPFANNQDIKHVTKMWEHLSDGGQMAVVMGCHWQFASDKPSKAFRSLVESVHHHITVLPKGTFKSSGTDVESIMLVLYKW